MDGRRPDGPFLVGVNLPWQDYGLDFGANAWQPGGGLARRDRGERLRPVLERLARQGVSQVRWFLLGDGRAGLREAPDGGLEPDDALFPDLDAALLLLRESGLQAIFVLLDFTWFARPRVVNGVRLHGRRRWVRDPARRAGLLEGVFRPLFETYGRHPQVAAWDLLNEPEWATLGLGTWDPGASVSRRQMRAFLGALAGLAHACSDRPVTVGSASVRWLGLVRGLGLDLYQAHWYETTDAPSVLEAPVETLGLDRPLLLGEYPTRGSRLPPREILAAARASGFAGALAWSVLAEDDATDADACLAACALA